MTSSLDDAAKAEVAQIVNDAIGARLDDLAKKFYMLCFMLHTLPETERGRIAQLDLSKQAD